MAQLSRAPRWRKSRYSAPLGENCVEVASLDSAVGVRDSKDPADHLQFSQAEWQAFVMKVRRSTYDL